MHVVLNQLRVGAMMVQPGKGGGTDPSSMLGLAFGVKSAAVSMFAEFFCFVLTTPVCFTSFRYVFLFFLLFNYFFNYYYPTVDQLI